MADRSFEKIIEQLNSLSPKSTIRNQLPISPDNLLELTPARSPSDHADSKKQFTGSIFTNQMYLTDDQIFSSAFKEIKIDADPLDFSDNTPSSLVQESDITPLASQTQQQEPVNYSNFESASFKDHVRKDSFDSVAYLNLALDSPRTQTGKLAPPLSKPKELVEDKNEFSKFYDNLYYTSLHGPHVVGAFILRNKDSKNEFLYSYPPKLNVNRSGSNDRLNATFSSDSYTCERDHTAELQSSIHLLPDLAFGSRKKDSLVDFVHFILPTSSGNVLYGTSYVLQFTEKVDNYNSILDLVKQNQRKEPPNRQSAYSYSSKSAPISASRTPYVTSRETTAKNIDLFNLNSATSRSSLREPPPSRGLSRDSDAFSSKSTGGLTQSGSISQSSTLKELEFLNFEPTPKKSPAAPFNKKNEFKPFDLFNFDSSPAKSEGNSSKRLQKPTASAGSGDSGAAPSSTTKVFSLIDFDDENDRSRPDIDEKEKNLFGVFDDLRIRRNVPNPRSGIPSANDRLKPSSLETQRKAGLSTKKDPPFRTEINRKAVEQRNADLEYTDAREYGFSLTKTLGIDESDYDEDDDEDTIFGVKTKTVVEFGSNLVKKLGFDDDDEEEEEGDKYAKNKKIEPKKKTSSEFSFDLAKILRFDEDDFKSVKDNKNTKSGAERKPGVAGRYNLGQDSDEDDNELNLGYMGGMRKNKPDLSRKTYRFGLPLKSDKDDRLGLSQARDRENRYYSSLWGYNEDKVDSGHRRDTDSRFGYPLIQEIGPKYELASKASAESRYGMGRSMGLGREPALTNRPGLDRMGNKPGLERRLSFDSRVLRKDEDDRFGVQRKLTGEHLLERESKLGIQRRPDYPASGYGPRSAPGSLPGSQLRQEQPDNIKRHYVAICLVYKVPFFGKIGSRLEYVAQTYFENKNFNDHSLLLSFLEHINKSDKAEDWSYESLFFNLENHFKPFSLCLSYRALLFLLKAVLAEQRIAIYSECAARTSTCILSLLTMIPCASALNFNSKTFGSLWYSWKKYGFPLNLFRPDNPIYPYFTESMVSLLDNTSGYLIGITDLKILRKFVDPPSLIFDLEDEAIKLRTRDLLGFYSPSFYEISFFNDFEIFEDMEIDDEPLKMVLDTSENIFHFVGDYLSKAPSTIIHLGGKASKIYHIGRSLGSRRHKESYLRLFDVYFPGALPKFLRFSKKQSKPKKAALPPEPKTEVDEGEDDMVGKQQKVSKPKKTKKPDTLEELKAQWDKIIDPEEEEATKAPDIGMIDEMVEGEMNQPAFTFQVMFEKMRRRSPNYRYLGYISTLQSDQLNDRTKEIEYSIFTRIQPLRDFLLKFLKSTAYAGGKGRRSYQLVMDFTFDLDSMVDFNNPVDGAYVVRDGRFLRGCMQDEPDSDVEDQEGQEEVNKKSYLMEGDEEVIAKVPVMLATFILELHNNYSIDFYEMWIQTRNFSDFFQNHNLEVFNEPVFYLSNNLAKYTYPNGDFYVGELSDLLRDGKGSYVSKDGSRYDGMWKRDKRHGKGTLITNDLKYTGDWINDRKHGFGRLETPSYSYVGDFRLNKYHGNGTMLFKNGVKMKGEFRNGRFEGKGIMDMPDGTVKMGTFKNGVITGVCSVIDREGRVYVGQLYGDHFHGKGVLKYNKQTSFEGFWVKGKREKQGMIINRVAGSTIKIEGVWENDNMLMNEVLVNFPNGYKYNGGLRYFPIIDIDLEQFKQDKDYKNLEPPITDQDLAQFLQDFKKVNNRLLPHGTGICKDTNGGVYNGSFFFGSRHGTTTQVFPNGCIFNGEYYLGRPHRRCKLHLQSNETIILDFDRGRLLNKFGLGNREDVNELLSYEYSVFEKDFTKYKLDFLVEVMKSTSTLQTIVTSHDASKQPFDDLLPIS